MTDLERMWDDLPTSEPPTSSIVNSARRREVARRRRVRIGGVAAAVGAAFMAGVIVANPPSGPIGADPTPAAFQADLKPAASCDDLLSSYRDRGLKLVNAWGWGYGVIAYEGDFGVVGSERGFDDLSTPLSNGGTIFRSGSNKAQQMPKFREQTSSDTGTNVQEAGVDEPDAVKTDGKLLVRMRGDRLVVHDVTGKKVEKLGDIRLPKFEEPELLLSGDTVVVIGADSTVDSNGVQRGSRVSTVSIKNPAEPKVTDTVTYDARIVSARQHGDAIRVVLSSGLPDLDFTTPEAKGVSEAEALKHNRSAVRKSSLDDWLPHIDAGERTRLLDCDDVAIPPTDAGLDTVSIVGFTAGEPGKPHAIGLAGATDIAYESADNLYLASTGFGLERCPACDFIRPPEGTAGGTSHLYDFELDGIDAMHVASGEVEGTIADRWSMDEADDVLRVAVGPSSETGNFNSVVTFKRSGDELVELGRLDGLGKGEQLKGMRWFDDLAVVVTYREIDPLFTIDLKNPAKPKLLGILKIPGYSDYLHPINDHQLIGVGYSSYKGGGAQIALFDVADLRDARRTDRVFVRGGHAVAMDDPRAFTWLPECKTALTVLSGPNNRGFVASVQVKGQSLSDKLIGVEYGDDTRRVRTIGLSDGRVVLVTGEDVRFLRLP